MKELEILAKIKVLIDNYFQSIGRDEIEDINEARMELIDDIDLVLEKVDIPKKYLIAEKYLMEKLK